ncbi:MAG: MFS transporter [Deltaproteobacteria bacterium]|nr:MFS transporter [Deltaproteobacteria bacterium]
MGPVWGGFRPNARAWLRAAACVGLGQQVFVVLRNQYLLELGAGPEMVARVQGAGGAAGIAAGLLGLWLLRHVPARTALAAGVALNAAGFAIQVAATEPGWMIAGAAVAGLGIQSLTMVTGPFLTSESSDHERVRLFVVHTLWIQAIPGAVGALVGGQVQQIAGGALASTLGGYRVALAVGLLSVAAGLVPLLALRPSVGAGAPCDTAERAPVRRLHDLLQLRRPLRSAALLAPDTLVFFGNGLIVPFLQIYFKERFHLAPAGVGGLYAVLMIAGGAGHLLSPTLARRFGTWPVILATQALCIPLFAELLWTDHVPLAAGAFVLRQSLVNMSAPLMTSLIHGCTSPSESGPIASYRMLMQSIAWAGGNFLAGPLLAADAGGFGGVLVATMAVHTTAIVTGLAVFPRAASATSPGS